MQNLGSNKDGLAEPDFFAKGTIRISIARGRLKVALRSGLMPRFDFTVMRESSLSRIRVGDGRSLAHAPRTAGGMITLPSLHWLRGVVCRNKKNFLVAQQTLTCFIMPSGSPLRTPDCQTLNCSII